MIAEVTVYSQSQIDPMVCFRNSQGESVRGTNIVSTRSLMYFAARARTDHKFSVTNVYSCNPKYECMMEHRLERHLANRNEPKINSIRQKKTDDGRIYADGRDVNLVPEMVVFHPMERY
jgi:hypothetical protein